MNGLPGQLRTIASRGRMDDADVQVIFDAADMIVKQGIELEAMRADFGRIAQIVAFAQSEAERAVSHDRCTCGFGGFHDDINPRCDMNKK